MVLIRSLQLIVHLPIFSIVVPSNVIMLFRLLIPIVMFDLLEQFQLLQQIFPDSEEDSELYMGSYSQIRDIGYDSLNIFMNLGTLAFLSAMYFLKVAFVLFIMKPLSYLHKGLKNKYNRYFKQVFFGDLIAILVEGYLEFLISSLLLLIVAP